MHKSHIVFVFYYEDGLNISNKHAFSLLDVFSRACSKGVNCPQRSRCNKIDICECIEGYFQRASIGDCIGEWIKYAA